LKECGRAEGSPAEREEEVKARVNVVSFSVADRSLSKSQLSIVGRKEVAPLTEWAEARAFDFLQFNRQST
jgi:hypothetical protein